MSTGQEQEKLPQLNPILQQIQAEHKLVAQQTIEWWLSHLPPAYFQLIPHETRMDHIRAIIALKMTNQPLEISLNSQSITTYIKPRNYTGLLADLIEALPKSRRKLRQADIFTATDNQLVIDVFEFDEEDHYHISNHRFVSSELQDSHNKAIQAFNSPNTFLASEPPPSENDKNSGKRPRRQFRADIYPQRLENLRNYLLNMHDKGLFYEHISDHQPSPSSHSIDHHFETYLQSCDESYVLHQDPAEIILHFYLLQLCGLTDGVIAVVGDENQSETLFMKTKDEHDIKPMELPETHSPPNMYSEFVVPTADSTTESRSEAVFDMELRDDRNGSWEFPGDTVTDSSPNFKNADSPNIHKEFNPENESRLLVILKSDHEEYAFRRTVRQLSILNVDISKARLVRVEDYRAVDGGEMGSYIIMSFYISQSKNNSGFLVGSPVNGDQNQFYISPNSPLAKQICTDVRLVPFVEKTVFKKLQKLTPIYFSQTGEKLSLVHVELIGAWTRLAHCLIAFHRPLVYAPYHLDQFLEQQSVILKGFLELWDLKFAINGCNSSDINEEQTVKAAQLSSDIDRSIRSQISSTDSRCFFLTLLAIIDSCVKSNWNIAGRRCLIMRFSPELLLKKDEILFNHSQDVQFASASAPKVSNTDLKSLPHSIYFAYGRELTAFYVKSSRLSRGGVRLSVANSLEQYNSWLRGLLYECINLAKFQGMKNKDIPESGAKAIILQDFRKSSPNVPSEIAFRNFVDGLLDMVNCKEVGNSLLGNLEDSSNPTNSLLEGIKSLSFENSHNPNVNNDHVESKISDNRLSANFEELDYFFLGPDENINANMVEWAHQRAHYRRHPYPASFFSSKSLFGISHTDYAVMAEGFSVYLQVGLRHLGIDCTRGESFSIKLIGSFVNREFGNMVRILCRDFGKNMKIIAAADSICVLEDPEGLNQDEILKLIDLGISIAEYPKEKLSSKSKSAQGQAAVKELNTLPFRLKSTVLVPGIPMSDVINSSNWKSFFDKKRGSFFSKLIVEFEGNFISDEAKTMLSKNGVMIFREVSATKCSVVSSSYETLCGLLLAESEFFKIKSVFIQEVLSRLRHLAYLEATIILKEFHAQAGQRLTSSLSHDDFLTIPELSKLVSNAIIKIKDAICQSKQIDIYIRPLPLSNNRNRETSKKRSGFFIESPPAINPEDYVDESLDELMSAAEERGFHYQKMFHVLCRDLLFEYLPPSLRHFARMPSEANRGFRGGEGQKIDQILWPTYIKRILATALACKIVYSEGIGFLDATLGVDVNADTDQISSPGVSYYDKITEYALKYLVEFQKTSSLIAKISKTRDLDTRVKSQIIKVLQRGGTRIGIEINQNYV